MNQTASANVEGVLHVGFVVSGRAWHSIRDGHNWQPFAEIPAILNLTREPVGEISDMSFAAIGGDLHVFAKQAGRPIHNVRLASGRWQNWAFVPIPVGHPLLGLIGDDES
jgi:hypothetical protein